MTQYTILGRLRLLAELDEARSHEALPYCAAAMHQLLPRLKPAVLRDDPRLDRAAAAMALCMLLLRGESGDNDGIESFKAGDISITKKHGGSTNDRLAAAQKEREAAMADIAELLRDTGFQVRTTRVK